MPRAFTDPGSKWYFDEPRNSTSKKQVPSSSELSAKDFSVKDTYAKIQKKMTKSYHTAEDRQKAAGLFIENFSTAFSEKIASLSKEAQTDVLASLLALGNFVKASKVIPQAPSKVKLNLGSQVNTLGKTVLDEEGLPVEPGKGPSNEDNPGSSNFQNPLTDMLPKYQMRLGVPQTRHEPTGKGR